MLLPLCCLHLYAGLAASAGLACIGISFDVAETAPGVAAGDCTIQGCAYPTVWGTPSQTAYRTKFGGVNFAGGNILFNTAIGKYHENVTTIPYLYYKATGALTANSSELSSACKAELGLDDSEFVTRKLLAAGPTWNTTSGFAYDLTYEISGPETFAWSQAVAAGDADKAFKLPVNITKEVSP